MTRPIIPMKNYASELIGKTIENVRDLTQAEHDELMWYGTTKATCVIEFTDGTMALVMADPEGNGPGHLETNYGFWHRTFRADKVAKTS